MCLHLFGVCMKAHGDYRIEIEDRIVHIYPCDGFNAEGIASLHKETLLVAPIDVPWVLFEHPRNIAGVTPEAVIEIAQAYKNLEKLNCIAIALEISSTWKQVFEENIIGILNIPVYLNSDISKLEQAIKGNL